MDKILSADEIAEMRNYIGHKKIDNHFLPEWDVHRVVTTLEALEEANSRRRAGIKEVVKQLRAVQMVAADILDILSGLVRGHNQGEIHQSFWNAAQEIVSDNGEKALSAVELPEYVKTDFTELFDAASHYWEENRLRVLAEKEAFKLKVMLSEERGEITETDACKLLKLYRVEYREQCHAKFSQIPAELRVLLGREEPPK